MKILFSKPIKIITFILLFVCTTSIFAVGMNFTRANLFNLNSLSNSDFKKTYSYQNQVKEIYSNLCVISEYYLKSIKEDGTVELTIEQKQVLRSIRFLDQNNEITKLSENFVYYASIEKHFVAANSLQPITKDYVTGNFNTYYYRIENQFYTSDNENPELLNNIYANYNGNELFSKNDDNNAALTIYIAPKNEYIDQNQQQITSAVIEFKKIILDLVPLVIIAFLLIIFQIIITGKTYKIDKSDEAAQKSQNAGRVPTEMVFVEMIVCTLAVVLLFSVYYEFKQIVEIFYNQFLVFQLIYSTILAFLAGFFFLGFLYLVRRLKQKNLLKSSFSYRIFIKIGQFAKKFWRNYILMDSYKDHDISKRLFLRQIIFFSLIVFILFITLLAIVQHFFMGFVLLLLAFSLLLFYIYQSNQDFKEISILCEHISQLYKGNNDYNSVVSSNSPVAEPAMQLNNISCGVKKSVDLQVKAERIKIDLVTNVSHDLKTPLTSIIGYIDLLSKQDLNPEALDYVKILEIKADRLKKIVSDLFELAKITSGNAELELEELDCVVLIKQVVADMEDAVLASNKIIKMTFEQENAPIFADGKKLYRVFQNLLDNALKYSLDGTRIFVDLKRIGNEVVTTIKNTASYELDFDEQEIQERFTRGDKSRTGDGNGLGLSIAKGFTNACGGHLEVDVDGDLFKVSVSFPSK